MIHSNLVNCACILCLPFLLIACGSDTTSSPVSTGGTGFGGSTAVGGTSGSQANAGGTTFASSGTSLSGSLEGYCAAQCDERYRCGSLDIIQEPRDACVSGCVNAWGPIDVYRGDVMAALQICLQNLACSANIDACNIVGANVVSSDPENDPRMVACMTKTSACAGYANPFNDDICLTGLFMVEAKQAGFDACLLQPCDAVLACVNQLRGRH